MTSNSPSKDVFEVEGRDCLAYKNKFQISVRRMVVSTKILEVKARNIK